MSIIILLLIFAAMAVFQVPKLIKKKSKKEFIVFSAFYIAAFLLSLLYVLDFNIPSPIEGVRYLIEDVLDIKYQ